MSAVKIRLRFGGAGVKAGDVFEVDEATAAALVANGNATLVPIEVEKPKKG